MTPGPGRKGAANEALPDVYRELLAALKDRVRESQVRARPDGQQPAARCWPARTSKRYAAQAVEHGWSRKVLGIEIATTLHVRVGAAPSNVASCRASPDFELATELLRDPDTFDHLTLTGASSLWS